MEDHQSLPLQNTLTASQLLADAISLTRLTTEIIRCIAMALLDKAEELERFQRMEDETAPSERPLSSDHDALYL